VRVSSGSSRGRFQVIIGFAAALIAGAAFLSMSFVNGEHQQQALASGGAGAHPSPACDAHQGGHDETAPFAISAPAGYVITAVCIKSGTNEFLVTMNGSVAGCYTVAGIGQQTVTVSGGGTGSTCQETSHIAAFWSLAATPTVPAPTPTGVVPTPTGVVPTPTGVVPTPTGVVPTPTGVVPTPTFVPIVPGTVFIPVPQPVIVPQIVAAPPPVAEVQTIQSAPQPATQPPVAAPVAEVQGLRSAPAALPLSGNGGYLNSSSQSDNTLWIGIGVASVMGLVIVLALRRHLRDRS
jgi:hypothetical protein